VEIFKRLKIKFNIMNDKEKDFLEVYNLMLSWRGKENRRVPAEDVRRIFNIHNKVTGINEYSVSCTSCRQRTWNRLKDWYDANKEQYKYLINE
jgi:hypothetical protein